MAPIVLTQVLTFTTEDNRYPAANLLSGLKWMNSNQDNSGKASFDLLFGSPSLIDYIDLAYFNVAQIEVQVGMSVWPGHREPLTLLPVVTLQTLQDARAGLNKSGCRMFNVKEHFSQELSRQKWDKVRVIVRQPHARNKQMGIDQLRFGTRSNNQALEKKLDSASESTSCWKDSPIGKLRLSADAASSLTPSKFLDKLNRSSDSSHSRTTRMLMSSKLAALKTKKVEKKDDSSFLMQNNGSSNHAADKPRFINGKLGSQISKISSSTLTPSRPSAISTENNKPSISSKDSRTLFGNKKVRKKLLPIPLAPSKPSETIMKHAASQNTPLRLFKKDSAAAKKNSITSSNEMPKKTLADDIQWIHSSKNKMTSPLDSKISRNVTSSRSAKTSTSVISSTESNKKKSEKFSEVVNMPSIVKRKPVANHTISSFKSSVTSPAFTKTPFKKGMQNSNPKNELKAAEIANVSSPCRTGVSTPSKKAQNSTSSCVKKTIESPENINVVTPSKDLEKPCQSNLTSQAVENVSIGATSSKSADKVDQDIQIVEDSEPVKENQYTDEQIKLLKRAIKKFFNKLNMETFDPEKQRVKDLRKQFEQSHNVKLNRDGRVYFREITARFVNIYQDCRKLKEKPNATVQTPDTGIKRKSSVAASSSPSKFQRHIQPSDKQPCTSSAASSASTDYQQCPICFGYIDKALIENHAALCGQDFELPELNRRSRVHEMRDADPDTVVDCSENSCLTKVEQERYIQFSKEPKPYHERLNTDSFVGCTLVRCPSCGLKYKSTEIEAHCDDCTAKVNSGCTRMGLYLIDRKKKNSSYKTRCQSPIIVD